MPTPRTRERLWQLATLLALIGAGLAVDADIWGGVTGALLVAAALFSERAGVVHGRRTATDAQIRAAVIAEVHAALGDGSAWRAWRKRTTRGGWVDAAELAAVAAYLRETLSREERA
jgi:hypothetical protein